jgi:hypothetical protein
MVDGVDTGGLLMIASRTIVLTLSDIEEAIGRLEQKYGTKSLNFLLDGETRALVSEDDIFEWEALLDHRNQLKEFQEDLHRKYLSRRAGSAKRVNDPDAEVLLAA